MQLATNLRLTFLHLQTYKVNEARELAHPVLFEGAADLLKNIVAQGGRNF